MNHLSEEDLVLLYYEEPGVPWNARVHLQECSTCRGALETLAQTLDACNQWEIPEASLEFRRTAWARLAPKLEDRTSQPRYWMRYWFAAAAVAALVLAAFLAGQRTSRPAPTIATGLSQQARERILEISLADHLERAQLLLTEVSNMDDSDAEELALDRARARDLVSEGRLLRQWPAHHVNAALLDQVERAVMEVANAPDRVDAEELRALQRRMDAESLLFKVRIIEANLRTSGQRL
jgi:hypothetical protein